MQRLLQQRTQSRRRRGFSQLRRQLLLSATLLLLLLVAPSVQRTRAAEDSSSSSASVVSSDDSSSSSSGSDFSSSSTAEELLRQSSSSTADAKDSSSSSDSSSTADLLSTALIIDWSSSTADAADSSSSSSAVDFSSSSTVEGGEDSSSSSGSSSGAESTSDLLSTALLSSSTADAADTSTSSTSSSSGNNDQTAAPSTSLPLVSLSSSTADAASSSSSSSTSQTDPSSSSSSSTSIQESTGDSSHSSSSTAEELSSSTADSSTSSPGDSGLPDRTASSNSSSTGNSSSSTGAASGADEDIGPIPAYLQHVELVRLSLSIGADELLQQDPYSGSVDALIAQLRADLLASVGVAPQRVQSVVLEPVYVTAAVGSRALLRARIAAFASVSTAASVAGVASSSASTLSFTLASAAAGDPTSDARTAAQVRAALEVQLASSSSALHNCPLGRLISSMSSTSALAFTCADGLLRVDCDPSSASSSGVDAGAGGGSSSDDSNDSHSPFDFTHMPPWWVLLLVIAGPFVLILILFICVRACCIWSRKQHRGAMAGKFADDQVHAYQPEPHDTTSDNDVVPLTQHPNYQLQRHRSRINSPVRPPPPDASTFVVSSPGALAPSSRSAYAFPSSPSAVVPAHSSGRRFVNEPTGQSSDTAAAALAGFEALHTPSAANNTTAAAVYSPSHPSHMVNPHSTPTSSKPRPFVPGSQSPPASAWADSSHIPVSPVAAAARAEREEVQRQLAAYGSNDGSALAPQALFVTSPDVAEDDLVELREQSPQQQQQPHSSMRRPAHLSLPPLRIASSPTSLGSPIPLSRNRLPSRLPPMQPTVPGLGVHPLLIAHQQPTHGSVSRMPSAWHTPVRYSSMYYEQ